MGDYRAQYHRNGEGDAKANADERHRFCPVLFAGEIGQQRHHGGGNRAGALKGAAKNNPPDGVGEGGNHTAQNKNKQATDNQWLSANPVREQAKRDLEDRLGQTVNANGQANQCLARPLQRHAVGGQNRQDHKHAEHP